MSGMHADSQNNLSCPPYWQELAVAQEPPETLGVLPKRATTALCRRAPSSKHFCSIVGVRGRFDVSKTLDSRLRQNPENWSQVGSR
jgi:hypothetical protein